MILTPEQIEQVEQRQAVVWGGYLPGTSVDACYFTILNDARQKAHDFQNVRDTLAAYAAVVERVAETDGWWCNCPTRVTIFSDDEGNETDFTQKHHVPDCIYLEARRLRGE